MALTTRVWTAGKLLLLAGALFLTYVIFAIIGMRVALKAREIQVPSLAGKTVTGTHLGSESFLLDIVLEGKVGRDVKTKPERFGLRAIRDVLKGKADAVLLDGTQYRALAGTQFEKQLKLLHTSKALPTPPVVVTRTAPPGFGVKLGQALTGMTDDPEGQEVVRIFRVEGFEVAAPKVWASLEKQIKSAP